ncbi:unnamed protein product, partial [Mesorhabditis belari]|uniref:C-type lectin domain-containing protein n=1 Tax=Mesorhabditis belari TaxID=2138241 RepID=A0AAF3FI72_9BILA
MNRFFIVYSIFYLETLYGLQTVNLTEQDTTWIASGYQTRQISPIIITPCSNCTQYIQVMMRFEDGTQTKTDFTITDSEGSQIQSTTFNSTSLQLLHGPLTIIDRSAVGSYSLSFRLHNVTDSIALYASRLFTIVPNTPVPYTYQTKGSGNYGTFATFSAMPALYGRSSLVIKPTNKTTTGCEYSLFQAGYPATNRGLNAYRIHTFTPENSGDRFALSIIPAFAATIYVPPRCPVSIDVADYTSPNSYAEAYRFCDTRGAEVVKIENIYDNAFIMANLAQYTALNCPSNSQEFNGYCYQAMVSLPGNYTMADTYCAGRGLANSHLASIMNQFENLYLAGLLPAGTKAFIGGMRQTNGVFTWSDGLPFSFDNVDKSTNGGPCLVIDQATKKWQQVNCSESHAFICKITETPPFIVSNSTGFKQAADYLLRGIDPTANPCEDFFQFTCGTYINNTSLNGKSRVGTFDEAQTQVNKDTAVALDAISASSSLTERIAQAAYAACVYNYNQDVNDKSKTIYQEITNAFGIPEIPFFLDPSSLSMFSIPTSQLFSAVGYFEGTHALGTLLFSWTTVDYQNIKQNALFMNQPDLPLPRDYYVKPQFLSIIQAHVQEYADLITMVAGNLGKTVDSNAIYQMAADVVNFEISIATASWSDEEQRNYKQMYNPYTISGLQANYPNIQWTAYFDNLLKNVGLTNTVFQSREAIVNEPTYFAWLNSLFSEQKIPAATIVNYIAVQAIYDSADFLGSGLSKLAEKNNRLPYLMKHGIGLSRTRRDRRNFDSINDFCVDIVTTFMPYGTGYVYVKQLGDLRNAIQADVATQTDHIISSFTDMIGTLSWMTPSSKTNANTKAAGLIKNIGWPDMFKDFKDTTDLDNYNKADYGKILDLDKTKFFEIYLILKSGMESRESLRFIQAPADRKMFLQSPALVNAWYQPERNSITFPFAIFNLPFYKLDWPQAVNYGGLGGVEGHELTHGYDDEGVQFGPDGSLSGCDSFRCGWMDMNSTAGFTDMAQCVVTQYTTQCCPVKTGNVHCANGAITQGENIADLGGQQAAYRAYRNWELFEQMRTKRGAKIENKRGQTWNPTGQSTSTKGYLYIRSEQLTTESKFATLKRKEQKSSMFQHWKKALCVEGGCKGHLLFCQKVTKGVPQGNFNDFKDTTDLDNYNKAPADRKMFLQSPALVNAWYQPERNSITFPFAIFNLPFYKLDWPQAVNYGGVQFGPDGSLSGCDSFRCGWMDMNSTAGFTDMAQCVVTQYTTQCCPVKTGNVHCANGAITQGENIADLGGQQAAYRAYQKYVATQLNGVEEQSLPGLEEYTPNQIFWIAKGFVWCTVQSIDSLVRQMLTNPHSPPFWIRYLDLFQVLFGVILLTTINEVSAIICKQKFTLVSNATDFADEDFGNTTIAWLNTASSVIY